MENRNKKNSKLQLLALILLSWLIGFCFGLIILDKLN